MLIDFVPTESGVSLAEAPGFLKAPGGAPAIVAIAVSRFGGRSAFVGKLGDNEFGDMLAGILRKNGVADQEFNFDTGARTALAFVTLKADGDREFMFYRNHSADMLLCPDELNLELIRSCSSYGFEFKSFPSTMIFLLFDSWFLCCHVSSALIPLSEFSEAAVMKKYGVKPDAETLDIANTAARQKSVSFFFPFFFWMDESLFKALSNANRGLGGLKRMIMGSVSNHVVNNVACHVTAVKAHH
uniref:Carbohydrate kinase PfkB domain-containing protein n=1 Tax=Brassica oleracea var. oleracea TaxID=109376 RepID=A0A0D3BWV3_BRAOL